MAEAKWEQFKDKVGSCTIEIMVGVVTVVDNRVKVVIRLVSLVETCGVDLLSLEKK